MITLSPKKIVPALIVIAVVLATASVLRAVWESSPDFSDPYNLKWLFMVGQEGSFATWLTATMLLFCFLLLAIMTLAKRVERDIYARHWGGLAVLFMLLSLHETLSVQQRVVDYIARQSGIVYAWYVWSIPFIIFLVVFLLLYRNFLSNLPSQARRWFIVSGTVYIAGLLVGKLIRSYYSDFHHLTGQIDMTREVIRAFEEGMEIIGVALFIYALMAYMGAHMKPVQIHFGDSPNPQEGATVILLSPRKITLFLVAVLVVLVAVGFIMRIVVPEDDYREHWLLISLLSISEEASVSTWFSAGLFLLATALLTAITYAAKRDGRPYRYHWGALALIFVYLSLDDTSLLHERTTQPLRDALNTTGAFYFAWIIPAVILVGIVALAYLPFVLRLPARTRLLFIVGAVLFLAGAIAIEMIGGLFMAEGSSVTTRRLISIFEESVEMLGIIVFNYALFSYIMHHVGDVQVRGHVIGQN